MSAKHAIDMANEELRVIKSERTAVAVRLTDHPLSIEVEYDNGHKAIWSGLPAVELRKALKLP